MQLNIGPTEFFRDRHNAPTEEEKEEMLKVIGLSSVDELIDKTIPGDIRLQKELNISKAVGEHEFLTALKKKAARNKIFRSYIGMGYYNTLTPNVILRNITENPGWYTAYTPYQAEIAQGRLEALLNFQTMVIDLTGMEMANASLLDEGTSAAEAMTMFLHAAHKDRGMKFFVDEAIFPQTIDVLKTRAFPLDIELVYGKAEEAQLDESYFGAIVQYPDNNGEIRDYTDFAARAAEKGVYVGVIADLLSLTLLTPPGEWGADAVVGTTQRFGVPLGFGGPHAAYFATKETFKRQIPGRIIGVSIDAQGNTAYRMALQTREQHIKRDKATSNICTAQVLLAIMAGMYGVYHGPDGLKRVAGKIHGLTKVLNNGLKQIGLSQSNQMYFDTLKVSNLDKKDLEKIKVIAEGKEINFRYFEHAVGISLDETTSLQDVEDIISVFSEWKGEFAKLSTDNLILDWKENLVRKSDYLTHEIFNRFNSEHEMLRYMKALENKDLSLTHSMISLGSCTMKLNATAEMIPITWPEFNAIHPFVPTNQVSGYLEVIDELCNDLVEITGFDGISLQPNSGAQGEYAGLMTIMAYLQDKGQGHRDIALIPSSAHGTNPASAVLAGMKVVVVKCLENGYIDIDDLRAKAEEHRDDLACLMVTYPSTNGVYEEGIKEITQIVHEHGGQVYMDGANMNAQVGLTNPGLIGADVCHLNLHKTFCIPHGGGGPGMGPICTAKHLTPYLPGHAVVHIGSDKAMGAVSSAPYGSPSILLISYAYIKLMGAYGLTEATKTAILNANYMLKKLSGSYQELYKGANGTVAHEMIIDPRPFKATAGIQVEDIAKRLMDYGFHAPTVSFPIPGTLMIEPTESEPKDEMDRFCQAMINIRQEIARIESGEWSKEDNPLVNAPHTSAMATTNDWNHAYTREEAVFPLLWVKQHKFWPSVARVDNSYGDRNLVCACLPTEAYIEMPS